VKTEIKEDFEIAAHDVTQGQWEAVMGSNPSWFSRTRGGFISITDVSDEELKLFPVENVSWDDAQAFIKKLNERERGRGYLYRLPTSAEWEYACRGGATSEEDCSYLFYVDKPTNDLSLDQANIAGLAANGKKPPGRPTRVGAYPSNRLGLCDMHGNVWQWCADLLDPEHPERVFRGGSWTSLHSAYCTASTRMGHSPTHHGNDFGFRLARVLIREQDK
jgi:formylglycine-generating enzyme required for sulfatase activity